jgi:hypothetical protein
MDPSSGTVTRAEKARTFKCRKMVQVSSIQEANRKSRQQLRGSSGTGPNLGFTCSNNRGAPVAALDQPRRKSTEQILLSKYDGGTDRVFSDVLITR